MVSFPDVIQIKRNGCIIRTNYTGGYLKIILYSTKESRWGLHHDRISDEITKKSLSLKKVVAKGVETNTILPSISVSLVSLKVSTKAILPTLFNEVQLEFGKHMLDLKSRACGQAGDVKILCWMESSVNRNGSHSLDDDPLARSSIPIP